MSRSDNYSLGEKREGPSRRWSSELLQKLVPVLIFATGLVGGILIGIYAYRGGSCDTGKLTTQENKNTDEKVMKSCTSRNPVLEADVNSRDIFAPLTTEEMSKAAKLLLENNVISGLKQPSHLNENYILYMYLLPPNKVAALKFLDSNGPNPGRYAHVHVQRGAEQDIMEYMIGPFGSEKINITELTVPGEIHFNSRPYDMVEVTSLNQILEEDMRTLTQLMSESFSGATYPDDLYLFFFCGPPGMNETDRQTRFNLGFKGYGDKTDIGEFDLIHLLPLSGTVHNPGTDSSSWKPHSFYYLNQGPYNTSRQLLEAYKNNDIRKVKLEKGYKDTLFRRIFPKTDDRTSYRAFASVPGARTYMPRGARYTIRGSHVEWMGWSFYISAGQIRGPSLFDIKFKGERIIYEHSVNDITLNYGSDSAGTNSLVYADATYGILGGDYPNAIMRGTDCPEYATLLNTSYWFSVDQKPHVMKAICIFEADGQEALWRHSGVTYSAGLRNRYLVVRVPVVIGNYDYIFQYDFFLDGKIFTYAKASGFIQAYFWDERNPHAADKSRDAFGYRVTDYSIGPLHDHMFGFKVDMDIINRNNSFKMIKWKAGNVLKALRTQSNITKVPPYFLYNDTRFIEWKSLKREEGLNPGENQEFLLIVNERNKNKWGVERGFQISPLASGSQNLPDSHPAMKPLSFTKYQCAVTKRKEKEQYMTSIYDVNRMSNPQGYLDLVLNNESIVDEDIVTWISIGFLHVPTSEDIPMTTRVQSGFLLKPFNFFDRTATFDMPQYTETEDGRYRESEPTPESCYEEQSERFCRFC